MLVEEQGVTLVIRYPLTIPAAAHVSMAGRGSRPWISPRQHWATACSATLSITSSPSLHVRTVGRGGGPWSSSKQLRATGCRDFTPHHIHNSILSHLDSIPNSYFVSSSLPHLLTNPTHSTFSSTPNPIYLRRRFLLHLQVHSLHFQLHPDSSTSYPTSIFPHSTLNSTPSSRSIISPLIPNSTHFAFGCFPACYSTSYLISNSDLPTRGSISHSYPFVTSISYAFYLHSLHPWLHPQLTLHLHLLPHSQLHRFYCSSNPSSYPISHATSCPTYKYTYSNNKLRHGNPPPNARLFLNHQNFQPRPIFPAKTGSYFRSLPFLPSTAT